MRSIIKFVHEDVFEAFVIYGILFLIFLCVCQTWPASIVKNTTGTRIKRQRASTSTSLSVHCIPNVCTMKAYHLSFIAIFLLPASIHSSLLQTRTWGNISGPILTKLKITKFTFPFFTKCAYGRYAVGWVSITNNKPSIKLKASRSCSHSIFSVASKYQREIHRSKNSRLLSQAIWN